MEVYVTNKKQRMKKLIIPLLIITLFSCKKESGSCWYCTFGTLNGVSRPDTVVCQKEMPVFFDSEGNNLPQNCKRK